MFLRHLPKKCSEAVVFTGAAVMAVWDEAPNCRTSMQTDCNTVDTQSNLWPDTESFLLDSIAAIIWQKTTSNLNYLVWQGNFNSGSKVNSVNVFQLKLGLIYIKMLEGIEWIWFMWYSNFFTQIQALMSNSVCELYTCSAKSQSLTTRFLENSSYIVSS